MHFVSRGGGSEAETLNGRRGVRAGDSLYPKSIIKGTVKVRVCCIHVYYLAVFKSFTEVEFATFS